MKNFAEIIEHYLTSPEKNKIPRFEIKFKGDAESLDSQDITHCSEGLIAFNHRTEYCREVVLIKNLADISEIIFLPADSYCGPSYQDKFMKDILQKIGNIRK